MSFLLETDVFINVPVLKDHNSTRMTAVLRTIWDCLGQGILAFK